MGDDGNLSLLFQHRAAGERRCWGLSSLSGPVQAPLSIKLYGAVDSHAHGHTGPGWGVK